ncbi:trypsin-like [Cotesia typhae]|uniref:trypsin-like n=1 Tax=Cotesia typhae TaxID=2053667 RepID=UPI003D69A235
MLKKMYLSTWCLLIILFSGSSHVTGAQKVGVLDRNARWTGRIVNGEKATYGQFPFIASLQKRWTMVQHFCGASIITDRWVLTAAHCVVREKTLVPQWGIVVVAGETNIYTYHSIHRQIRNADQLVVNPRFDMRTLANDIALVSLQSPFVFTRSLQPIPLSKSTSSGGTNCTVAGWGHLGENNRSSVAELMYVHLPIIDYDFCGKLLWGITNMHPSMICAGYLEGGKDACQGDSGGPLVCGDLLAGIVSGGRGCARPKLPGFYTNVAYYKRWIDQVLRSNGRNHSYNGSNRHPASALAASISASLVYILSCPLVIVYLQDIIKI